VCRLCWQDAIGVKNALERYEDVDPSFGDSRECKLLRGLADAAEEGDQDAFTNVLGRDTHL
jgi:alpha-soluble NSF attachment protein